MGTYNPSDMKSINRDYILSQFKTSGTAKMIQSIPRD